ncbi:MAG: hypothetical protein HYY06_19960 [Deltaproteobacteria bacterium]|nr:hypothetical protein [Deltaproteobacteria bacterium]
MALLLAATACDPGPPPSEKAAGAARAFIEAFAAGDYAKAARHAEGDVLRGVEVQRRAREEERAAHPAEVALFEKAMREHPPRVEVLPPRDAGDHLEVRVVVTTDSPRGPERTRYALRLAKGRTEVWRVRAWERR